MMNEQSKNCVITIFDFYVSQKAGLASPSNPEQIVIALEPEAASVYCRERKLRDFVAESGTSDALVADTLDHTNTHYVVIDIGGKSINLLNPIHLSVGRCVCPSVPDFCKCVLVCLLP